MPASVLDGAAYPLTIDPTVSSGRGVDVLGANPAIAFNGADYNLLPCDSCADPTGRGANSDVIWNEVRGGDWDMLGTRISNGGTVLDSGGKVIAATSQHETSGSKGVTFHGVYFVA